MTPNQLMAKFDGNRQKAGEVIGYTPQRIGQWIKAGRIPERAQELISARLAAKCKRRKKVERAA